VKKAVDGDIPAMRGKAQKRGGSGAGSDELLELSRLLVLYADGREDGYGTRPLGCVRRAARKLAELAARQPGPSTCEHCGKPVVQPASGRRRRYCSGKCRKRAARRRGTQSGRNAKLVIVGKESEKVR
jgi:hypothetical protein